MLNKDGGNSKWWCDCKPGFHRNTSSPNVLQCIDDDECSLPGACVNGLCSNMPGSYTCYCPPGYSIGNDVARNFVKICVPNDACAKAKAAGKVTCIYPVNSCYNTLDHPWGYSCACIVGTEVVNTTSGMGCVETPCSKATCQAHSTCVPNANLGYSCECLPGYRKSLLGAGLCLDTNECGTTNASKAAACGPAVSNCTNTIGSYACSCKPGYHVSADGTKCEDINECYIPRSCLNGTCVNHNGSFTCACPSGYESKVVATVNGHKIQACVDINECSRYAPFGVCAYGTCNNFPGSYNCTCPYGFLPDTKTIMYRGGAALTTIKTCKDECATNSTNWCGPHGTCVNLNGTYTCNCTTPGYRLGRTLLRKPTCVWDPCAAYRAAALQAGTTPPCAVFGICFNLASANATYPRGYYCDCTAGYMPSTVAGGDTTCISTVSRPPTCATLLSNPCAPGNCTNAAVPADNSCGWDCRCSLPLIRTLGPNGGCPRCSLVTIGDL